MMEDYVILGKELYDLNMTKHHDCRVWFAFGCTTRETNLFRTQQADGILGLGVSSNRSSFPNIIDYTFAQRESEVLSFSLCIAENQGFLAIGGHNFNKHYPNTKPFTVNLTSNVVQYNINIHGIHVAERNTFVSYPSRSLSLG